VVISPNLKPIEAASQEKLVTEHSIDYKSLTDGMRAIAQSAATVIMSHYVTEIVVDHKDDNSPVTIADKQGEEIILAGLKKLAPHIPIVSEEAASEGHIPEFGDCFFLVDPLDGTREFINKNGEFTVNIALIENGVPTAGVVYAPAIGRMFYAQGPDQAFEQSLPNGENGATPAAITVRTPDEDGLVVVASRSHRDERTDEYLNHYKIKEFVAAGSSLKFCLVAAGEADLYPRHGRTMEWDTAAGHAVLAAAGGSVTQLDGTPFLYGKTERGLDNPFFVAKGGVA